MQSEEIKAEIAALEIAFYEYENLLDEAIRNSEELDKTKIIFHELKLVSDKLQKLKATEL